MSTIRIATDGVALRIAAGGWENDIDAALNYAKERPAEGPEALIDEVDIPKFGASRS